MPVETVSVKLITIICASELEDHLAEDLRALGHVSGYTITKAAGRGLHGPRTLGFIDSGNVRIEILLRKEKAEALLKMLASKHGDDALTAFVQDVEAFPPRHFA